jgi:hypothetical protein
LTILLLLGPGSPEFFPSSAFIEPAQQAMFPFQILLRTLPPLVEAKLWKQVPRWPEGLHTRVFAAAAWRTRQKHPFATGKRSGRVHRLKAPNSTNMQKKTFPDFVPPMMAQSAKEPFDY